MQFNFAYHFLIDSFPSNWMNVLQKLSFWLYYLTSNSNMIGPTVTNHGFSMHQPEYKYGRRDLIVTQFRILIDISGLI